MEYSVQSGDTLSQIAKSNSTTVANLLRLNPQIEDPNRIQVGQTLRLPESTQQPRQNCKAGQVGQDSQCAGTQFDLAFYWNDEVQSLEAIYTELYGSEMHFARRSLFDRNNEHLGKTVLPGEIVVVSSMPRTNEDREQLNKLKAEARLASEGIQQLTPEEATTVKRHLEIFDYVSAESIASTQSATLGVLSTSAGQRLGEVKKILENINKAYVDELARSSGGSRLSPAFYAQRQQLFGQLDNAANRLTMSRLNIRQYNKIKHTLGLSTKSILHNANEILDRGQVPKLGQRINTVSAWAKGSKQLGYVGIAIDAGVRTTKIYDACTIGNNQQCEKVSFTQVGGLFGAVGGGYIGGLAGAKVAVLAVGGIAILLGVTVGAPVLAVVALVGAGAGGLIGGTHVANKGEHVGETIYNWKNSF
jgi:LysM repeat protein